MTDPSALVKFWPLIYAAVREFWAITEPYIEDAAIREDVPIELYLYSELGLEHFSVADFQKRDPFTNPELFEKMFARFEVKDWIFPLSNDRYQVSDRAKNAVRRIIRAGDVRLAEFEGMPLSDLRQLLNLLKILRVANLEAPEPPGKNAILARFRVTDEKSPLIVQVREFLMDLYAYRDDSHLTAARPHFGGAGVVWDVLGTVSNGSAVNAAQMAERMTIRGYEENDYEVAIQAAVQIGWMEAADLPNTFRPTAAGRELRESVEKLTDDYFYRPWAVLTADDTAKLFDLLTALQWQLSVFKKAIAAGSHH